MNYCHELYRNLSINLNDRQLVHKDLIDYSCNYIKLNKDIVQISRISKSCKKDCTHSKVMLKLENLFDFLESFITTYSLADGQTVKQVD